jgi:hypothetical protein
MIISWVGHEAHNEQMRCANFSWKTCRERPLKRLMHSLEDNIKVDHKVIGRKVLKWINLA